MPIVPAVGNITGWVLVLMLKGGETVQVPGYNSIRDCEMAASYVSVSRFRDDPDNRVRPLSAFLIGAGCVPGPEIAPRIHLNQDKPNAPEPVEKKDEPATSQ